MLLKKYMVHFMPHVSKYWRYIFPFKTVKNSTINSKFNNTLQEILFKISTNFLYYHFDICDNSCAVGVCSKSIMCVTMKRKSNFGNFNHIKLSSASHIITKKKIYYLLSKKDLPTTLYLPYSVSQKNESQVQRHSDV